MRSRDGNHPFTFSVFSIIFLSSLALNASEYLISYRYVVKDALLYNENIYISKAMQKCEGNVKEPVIIENIRHQSLKQLISQTHGKFIDYIHKLGLHVEHNDINTNSYNNSTTILTLKTTCFKVDFNEDFVRIAPIK